jgi:hypothetical protein
MAVTTITVTYSTYGSGGVPTGDATQQLPIPGGVDATLFVRNIYFANGFWFTGATGNQVFIPVSAIQQITSP